MATDHRGQFIHAGRREIQNFMYQQRGRGGLPIGKTWDLDDPEVWSAYHGATDTLHRSETASLFNPYENPTNMWSKSSGRRMMKNAFEDPDTAHISLSNDEYI